MTGFNRRGACPSLAEPMQTGDGLLVRMVLDELDIAPAKLVAVVGAAARHGNGIVEITRRGNLQIRGLTPESAKQLATDIAALDLSAGGLPITMGALAGLDRAEIVDPRPLAETIRRKLDPDLRDRLAPKISLAIDGGGRLPLDTIAADIRLSAVADGKMPCWHVAVGGNAASAVSLGLVSADDAPALAIELLRRIAAKGSSARARDLDANDLSDLDMAAANAPAALRRLSPVGRFSLNDGGIAVGIALSFGATRAETLLQLLEQAIAEGATSVRLAPGRAILFIGTDGSGAGGIESASDTLGFVTRAGDPRLAISACAGAPACAAGLLDTRSLAARLATAAPSLLDGSFTLHVSGCVKRCADMPGPRLTVMGRAGNCQLLDETVRGSQPIAAMDQAELTVLFSRLEARYGTHRGKSAREFLLHVPLADTAIETMES
ncbi:MAG: precorrin-3B synthase [Rhizobiaceae bacterium]